jgi:7,8-dihydropterin-6-yl-methyl-4-(beta-D-ribofuranosyl)aminobenzene 5'-phosphate synthase
LRDTWNVEWIAPDHCTGEPAFEILKKTFGDRYLYAGVGTAVELGPDPASSERTKNLLAGFGEGDLRTNRELARSDTNATDFDRAHTELGHAN